MSEPTVRRRSAVRYKLQLPVIFSWNDGKERTEAGFTCDVALDGALIQSAVCPPIGTDVRIEILIPSQGPGGDQVRIQCSGMVTRAGNESGVSTFGVHGFFDDDNITRQLVN
jgi:hypothetical protein